MTLFERIFGSKRNDSASKAKDRLTIMLAHERADCAVPYLDDLKRDLLEVIKKYTQVRDIQIKTENNQNVDMLEIEIQLD
ncbi:MAG TPA: cell division topological specificity factor MinE, partial [Campylobacteraceae bacterium]|nr:cell division topological specificity factor MinE [Campylobacteraceae bacterium]